MDCFADSPRGDSEGDLFYNAQGDRELPSTVRSSSYASLAPLAGRRSYLRVESRAFERASETWRGCCRAAARTSVQERRHGGTSEKDEWTTTRRERDLRSREPNEARGHAGRGAGVRRTACPWDRFDRSAVACRSPSSRASRRGFDRRRRRRARAARLTLPIGKPYREVPMRSSRAEITRSRTVATRTVAKRSLPCVHLAVPCPGR